MFRHLLEARRKRQSRAGAHSVLLGLQDCGGCHVRHAGVSDSGGRKGCLPPASVACVSHAAKPSRMQTDNTATPYLDARAAGGHGGWGMCQVGGGMGSSGGAGAEEQRDAVGGQA